MEFTPEQIQYMRDNYSSLDERDKETLRRLAKSPTGELIGQILGPQFIRMMNTLAQPKRGLAAPR